MPEQLSHPTPLQWLHCGLYFIPPLGNGDVSFKE